jgi:hypothetical protein
MKVKATLKIGALLLVVAFILIICVNVSPVPMRVQVTFTGFTTLDRSYSGASPARVQFDFIPTTNPITLAEFCVSNAGNCSVIEDGAYSYEITNKPVDVVYLEGTRIILRELKPGEFTTISLPTSQDNKEPWRVALSFSKIDWRYRLTEKPSGVPGVIRDLALRRWYAHHLQRDFYSDWVNGPELVLAPTNTPNTATK